MESIEASTCASPCAGVESALFTQKQVQGAWCLGISTWSLALGRPLSPPIWGTLGHPRSGGACNSGLTNKLHHALAHTRDGTQSAHSQQGRWHLPRHLEPGRTSPELASSPHIQHEVRITRDRGQAWGLLPR